MNAQDILAAVLSARGRAWIYRVALASVPLLVAYDVISADKAPTWLGVIAAAFGVAGPAVALGHVTPDPVVEGDGDDASL